MQSVNPATVDLFGYSADEMLGSNVAMLMPSPQRDDHDQYIRDYLDTGFAKIIGIGREVTARRKDGTLFPVHLAVSAISTPKRNQAVFVGFIRNLSQYKETELKMQSKILMNERLAAIGQTVSGLAHESRNALQRSHACLAELELDLERMPSSLNLVRKVQRALDDLHHQLEEVRQYAAPIILERRPCCIEQLVRDVWQEINDATQARDVVLEMDVQADFPKSCRVDGDRLKRVIRNLLDNAWYASHVPRRIQVNLHHCVSPDEGQICRIEVIDNGSGVSEPEREKIFAPFYTTKTKGTGLGLALSRRYVEAHDGRIFVEPVSPEHGACFVIEIPIVVHHAPGV